MKNATMQSTSHEVQYSFLMNIATVAKQTWLMVANRIGKLVSRFGHPIEVTGTGDLTLSLNPHFDDDTKLVFSQLISKSTCYLEYGSGGSTLYALKNPLFYLYTLLNLMRPLSMDY